MKMRGKQRAEHACHGISFTYHYRSKTRQKTSEEIAYDHPARNAPSVAISACREAAAVAEGKPVDHSSDQLGKGLVAVPRAWAGEAAQQYLTDVGERGAIYLAEGLGHPGLIQRVMNRVLVDN